MKVAKTIDIYIATGSCAMHGIPLAEVAVPREMFAAILERISRLSLAPG